MREAPSWSEEAGADALLGKATDSVSAEGNGGSAAGAKPRRRGLAALRRVAAKYTPDSSRLGGCGRWQSGRVVPVLRYGSGCAFGGLMRCGLTWLCPVCSTQIRAERAADVRRVVEWHATCHGSRSALLLTLTVRHQRTDDLRELRQGVAEAWRRVAQGRAWMAWCERVGLVGTVRALEVVTGPRGWHPHLHLVVLVRDVRELQGEQGRAWLAQRWRECVRRVLGDARVPDMEHGCDLRACHRVDYLAKLGLEVAAPGEKETRKGVSRSPFQLLADIGRKASAGDVALWREWARAMRGARQLTWSRGLRAAAGLGVEATDEAIVSGEVEGELVIELTREEWLTIRDDPDATCDLLEAAERGGAPAVCVVLGRYARGAPPQE